ncbi:LpqB family beta-propeller domain-containing protein [Nocardioides sp. Bht2]|uniref:LpqB family beta-propeller domain-containing protein n=1 Tax=Nocardioides sp. Bht2 TaxID=3392297 RepID=UPI0039B55628
MRRRTFAPLMLLAALVCTACVSLPTEGGVRVTEQNTQATPEAGFPYNPRPPQPGETPAEIVRHFLDAMTANPISTAVARQFLSAPAREGWRPNDAMITYADLTTPLGGSTVEVNLLGAHRLDSRGAWQGKLNEEQSRLDFSMVLEDGEWRINTLPNAMIVTDSWFADRYTQASLFFFDPTGTILVPEPVFVPRGDQLATALVSGLLRGPVAPRSDVSQSFIPRELQVEFSIPVPQDGLAEVALTGDVPNFDNDTLELMTAQIAWTLRQDPSIERFRVTLNGNPITGSGTRSDVDTSIGEPFDPAVRDSWLAPFALLKGRMISLNASGEQPLDGPFGRRSYGLRSMGLDLNAELVAGIADDGRTALLAPAEGDGEPQVVLSRASNLLKPAWDHVGALWLLDAAPSGAVVRVVVGGKVREVQVPGVTGEQVVDFVVSRDGSRLVAIVAGRGSDRVVVSRLARRGSQVRGVNPRVVWSEPGEKLDLRALAWRTPTEVLVARAIAGDLTQVTRRSVDGSAGLSSGDVSSELVRDRVTALVSSPLSGSPAWAVGAQGQAHLVASREDGFVPAPELRALTYVG